jgi:hypothetical protein
LRSPNDKAERRQVSPIRGLGRWKDTMHKEARRHGRLLRGVTLLLKATLLTCVPSRRGLSLLQHAPRPSSYGAGAGSHTSYKPAQNRRSQTTARVVRATAQQLQAALHFCPDQRAKGRAAMQAACNRAKWAHFSDSQHAQHGGPGPRVMQPARRMLRACNCTATCATTAPPRLRNQYRDSRRPSARPSSASLARRSMRPKMGRQ